MAIGEGAYNPLVYHDGTVWPHDNSLVAWGLARSGRPHGAARILRAMVEAAAHFDYRLPEVFAGFARDHTRFPVVYPTASSPQAWAAATPVLLLQAVLGLAPDRAERVLRSEAPSVGRACRRLSFGRPWSTTDRPARRVPILPRGFSQAIARALANEDREFAETRWSDALSASPRQNWGGVTFGRRAVASRTVKVAASPQQTFAPIQRIGGKTGWYYANSFWRLRGLLDNVVGGVGLRRGRRDPVRLSVGDTLDFWRVEAFEQDRLLRLSSEMKSPGRIWLQFEVDDNQAETTLRQTAIFDPHGLAGRVYWYALYPIHYLIFEGMLRRIRRVATESRGTEGRTAAGGV
jgi:hypothetical protein